MPSSAVAAALAVAAEHGSELIDALLPAYGAWVYAAPDLQQLLGERLRWLRELAAL